MHKNRQNGIRKARNTGKAVKPESFDRTEVLSDLRDMLAEMAEKVCKGRIRDKAAFDLKLRSLKAFSYGVQIYSHVLDAVENEDVIRRLEALEDTGGGAHTNDKREK